MWHVGKRRRGSYSVLVGGGDRERERQLGRPRRRWEYDIKMDLKISDGGEDGIRLAQDTDRCWYPVNLDMKLPVQ